MHDQDTGADTPRRVVCATGTDGLSRVAFDGPAPASLNVAGPGSAVFHNMWRTEPADDFPYRLGAQDPATAFAEMSNIFPGPGGSHFTISTWPPRFPPADTLDLWMHSTQTIDYILILSGEMTCFFDSGERVTLRAGDSLIQNGTAHAWRNEGDIPCTMAAIAISAIPA